VSLAIPTLLRHGSVSFCVREAVTDLHFRLGIGKIVHRLQNEALEQENDIEAFGTGIGQPLFFPDFVEVGAIHFPIDQLFELENEVVDFVNLGELGFKVEERGMLVKHEESVKVKAMQIEYQLFTTCRGTPINATIFRGAHYSGLWQKYWMQAKSAPIRNRKKCLTHPLKTLFVQAD
jgi:hypothetical protein